jgi:hypothetical protein
MTRSDLFLECTKQIVSEAEREIVSFRKDRRVSTQFSCGIPDNLSLKKVFGFSW